VALYVYYTLHRSGFVFFKSYYFRTDIKHKEKNRVLFHYRLPRRGLTIHLLRTRVDNMMFLFSQLTD